MQAITVHAFVYYWHRYECLKNFAHRMPNMFKLKLNYMKIILCSPYLIYKLH